jgi:hypothetical protein
MLMELDEVKKSILAWMENFLEVEHPALGKWAPCPYARKARLDGRIEIRLGKDPYDDIIDIASEGIGNKEVVVFAYDPQLYHADQFHYAIQEANQQVREQGFISLDDHPDLEESVNGVVMNHGDYALSIVAPTANLDDASAKLYKAGYYNNWSNEYMDDVFTGRKDPRES